MGWLAQGLPCPWGAPSHVMSYPLPQLGLGCTSLSAGWQGAVGGGCCWHWLHLEPKGSGHKLHWGWPEQGGPRLGGRRPEVPRPGPALCVSGASIKCPHHRKICLPAPAVSLILLDTSKCPRQRHRPQWPGPEDWGNEGCVASRECSRLPAFPSLGPLCVLPLSPSSVLPPHWPLVAGLLCCVDEEGPGVYWGTTLELWAA